MQPPLSVRRFTDGARDALQAGLRSSDAVTPGRSQILLASARGETPPVSARQLGCAAQTVRTAIRACNDRSTAALQEGSPGTHPTCDAAGVERLPALAQRHPGDCGHASSIWTLDLVATERARQGLTSVRVSTETIRQAILRLGRSWTRAQRWITRPDPASQNNRRRDWLIRLAARHPDWPGGVGDETWWTGVRQPSLPPGTEEPLRLVEQVGATDDPDPTALACSGLLLPATAEGWLRVVEGRPRSAITLLVLADCCDRVAARGTTAVRLLWDTGHSSTAVKSWIRVHNRQVTQEGHGVRILACQVPITAPWLHPLEPTGGHGKRASAEPARLLSAAEGEDRVCASFGWHLPEHLMAHQAA